MPAYVVRRVQDLLNRERKSLNGARVLLLGVTYKADIADQRESPAPQVARLMRISGADVHFHDPYIRDWDYGFGPQPRVDDLDAVLAEADITVLLQGHERYVTADLPRAARLLFDTRGIISDAGTARL